MRFVRLGLVFAAALLVFTAVVRTQAPQGPATTAATDALFDKIYPVFASPRCTNCHGIVEHYPGFTHSVTPGTHPGGAVGAGLPDPVVDCTTCHDATEEAWQVTAPPNMEWAGLDKDQTCIMEATEARLMNAAAGGDSASLEKSYLHHLSTDLLIQSAWLGWAGGARAKFDDNNNPRPKLDPPPLPYQEFLIAAGEWIKAGAPCRATGYLSNVESQETDYTTDSFGMKVAGRQSASRSVNIVRNRDGSATAIVKASGFDETVSTVNVGTCEIVTTVRNDWSRKGPAQVPAKLEITAKEDEYSIHFEVPPDTTNTETTTRVRTTCPFPAPIPVAPPSSVELTWEPWVMDLRCPTEFPNHDATLGCLPTEPHDKGAADGAFHTTVKISDDAAEPRSWLLHSPMAVGRVDGERVPVHVQVTWAFRLNQK